MKTIQLTIEESLLNEVDLAIQGLDTTRSAFILGALQQALTQLKLRQMEKLHTKGYVKYPVEIGEFEFR
jgi:metal-responsive CopG/Arc/MetJ family transcriptional regulator